jgi:hypothetical protein
MCFFTAHVHNGRLVLDEPTDLPEGTLFELVSTDDVLINGGDLLDAELAVVAVVVVVAELVVVAVPASARD